MNIFIATVLVSLLIFYVETKRYDLRSCIDRVYDIADSNRTRILETEKKLMDSDDIRVVRESLLAAIYVHERALIDVSDDAEKAIIRGKIEELKRSRVKVDAMCKGVEYE